MLILALVFCVQPLRRIGEMQGADVQQPREEQGRVLVPRRRHDLLLRRLPHDLGLKRCLLGSRWRYAPKRVDSSWHTIVLVI